MIWQEQPRYGLNNSPHNGSSQHGNPCPWTPLEQSPLYPRIKHVKCKHLENNEQIWVVKKITLTAVKGQHLCPGLAQTAQKIQGLLHMSMTNTEFSSLCHFSGGENGMPNKPASKSCGENPPKDVLRQSMSPVKHRNFWLTSWGPRGPIFNLCEDNYTLNTVTIITMHHKDCKQQSLWLFTEKMVFAWKAYSHSVSTSIFTVSTSIFTVNMLVLDLTAINRPVHEPSLCPLIRLLCLCYVQFVSVCRSTYIHWRDGLTTSCTLGGIHPENKPHTMHPSLNITMLMSIWHQLLQYLTTKECSKLHINLTQIMRTTNNNLQPKNTTNST